MRGQLIALALTSVPAAGLAAPRPPAWRALADCAAAYAANADIADPQRAASMRASISDVGDDYAAAAVRRLRRDSKVAETKAAQTVRERVSTRKAAFAGQPRPDIERFIEACPQPDD